MGGRFRLCVLASIASHASADVVGSVDAVTLLQAAMEPERSSPARTRDLVLMHIPFNFGHTVETVAMFDEALRPDRTKGVDASEGKPKMHLSWPMVQLMKKRNGEVWGHFNPDLQKKNNLTGCSMFYTPPKYWPQDLADKYFGNKTVFGIIRDPYERIVSMFRAGFEGYGGFPKKFHDTCDLNGGIKYVLNEIIGSGDKFRDDCSFLPQAEYYGGRHGIELPVDTRRFPHSMNEVFASHGYTNMFIRTKDVAHIRGCDNVWAGDLDAEARRMIRAVYSRDFNMICKLFDHCNQEDMVCSRYIPGMCPEKEFAWDSALSMFKPIAKPGGQVKQI